MTRKLGLPKRGWKSFYGCTSALVGAAAVLMPAQALAQVQDPAAEQVEDEEDQIVVTGTRIRNEFNSPSPIQVITTEQSILGGSNDLAEVLQSSSLASGSPQNDATISSAFVTQGGPGSETVSLRGLGANRTLVLLNGRRAGPAGTRGEVSAFDLGVLPLAITERTDILKDGASSVYGSDAVAGVVNIITRRDIDGGQIDVHYNAPFEEGGEEIAADAIWGRQFSRGFLNVAVNYDHQSETKVGSRHYTNCAEDYTFDAVTGARNDVIDPRTGSPACRGNTLAGQVWLYDYSGEGQFDDVGANFIQFDGTGQIGALVASANPPSPLFPGFGPGVPANWFWVDHDDAFGVTNYNSQYEQDASFIPETEHTSLFLEGAYDLNNDVEAYAEVLLNRRVTRTNGFRQVWNYLYSYDYTYFYGPGAGDPFSTGWSGNVTLSPTVVTDHFDSETTVDYRRIVAGLRGDVAGRLGRISWDVYLQDSHSDGAYQNDVILQDAVFSAEGRSDTGSFGIFNPNSIPRATASCVGLNTPISNRPCVDVDWLSPTLLSGGGFSPEEEAFLYDEETGHTEYTQRFVEASISGDIFQLPAGNVGFALGTTFRHDEILDTPGEITRAGNSWGLTAAGITAGDSTTGEVFGELAIPLLRDAALADSLDLTLSGRFTDVSTYGSNATYKVGLNWQLTDQYRLRFTHGTSFRAPALFELFLADQTSFARQTADPCTNWGDALADGDISQNIADNCAADGIPDDHSPAGSSMTVTTFGNRDGLEAETSEATVFGFVWTPSAINLNVAIDYFQIEVSDEVTALGASNILFGCYDSQNFATEPLCGFFERGLGSDGLLIATVSDPYLNISNQLNRGLDLTAAYEHEFGFGVLNVQGQFTWQFEDTIEIFEGFTTDNNGAIGDPDFTGAIDVSFRRDNWTAFWGVDLIGTSSDRELTAEVQGGTRFDLQAEFTAYHALSLQREFDTWKVLVGVANVLDTEPPRVSTTGAAQTSYFGPSAFASQYDYLGRRGFLRVSKTF